MTEEHLSQKFLNQALARITALERLVAAKDEALQHIVSSATSLGRAVNIAKLALDLKCEEVPG